MSDTPPRAPYRTLFLGVLCVMLVAAGGWWYVTERIEAAGQAVADVITEKEATMAELLRLLERSEGDEFSNTVIRDCPDGGRQAFDALLSRLDAGLTAAELDRLEGLYYRCGDFFAVRRHLMALRLTETVAQYDRLHEVLADLYGNDHPPQALTLWQEVADLERQKSEYFVALVDVQGKIIAELQAGKRSGAPAIVELQQQAQEIQQEIGATTIEINAIKESLNDV